METIKDKSGIWVRISELMGANEEIKSLKTELEQEKARRESAEKAMNSFGNIHQIYLHNEKYGIKPAQEKP